jgi:hypothetical protein
LVAASELHGGAVPPLFLLLQFKVIFLTVVALGLVDLWKTASGPMPARLRDVENVWTDLWTDVEKESLE